MSSTAAYVYREPKQGCNLKAKMPVILVETLADFGLLAFEVYVYVNLKDQQWGGRGGGGGVGKRGSDTSSSTPQSSLLCFQEVPQ